MIAARYASLVAFAQARAFCPTGKGGGIDNSCSVGINVNDKHQDFTVQILAGAKTTETRITHSLKPYVGKTVGIVRTGKGKATLVGTMKIGEPKFYKTKDEFDADFDKHQIAPDSPHYIGPEGKYGYPLSEVKPVKPVTLDSKGIVARVIHKSEREVTVEYHLGGESPEHPRESRGDAAAPPKDRIKGSDVNDEGSAKNKSGDISLSDATVAALAAKAEEHNAAMRERNRPDWTHVRLGSLKAVWRRGAGAFSTSHRPGMTRDRWAMARVNAFLALARRGRPENSKYVSDNDLLHSEHPKHSDSRAFCPNGEGNGIDNSCGPGGARVLTAPDAGGVGGGGSSTPSPYKHFPSEQEALKAAVGRWKGQTSDLGIHVQAETDGAPLPSSASGQKMREMAAALLKEVKENSKPAPTLYRGDDKTTDDNSSALVGWTSSPRVAEKWAREYGGTVQTLEGASGVRLADIVGKARDVGEDEWILLNTPGSVSAQLKPSWMGKADASGSTSHGAWFLEKNTKQHESPGHGDVTTHVVSLVDASGNVKAFAHADLSDDKSTLYMNYGHVDEPHRGHGVYKSLLESLSGQFRIVSDEEHNVAPAVKKAYESLGARIDRYGHYVLDKKQKKFPDRRSSDCGREDDGRFAAGNKCGSEVDMPKEDPRGRLRYDNGVQTDAARKLYQMGSSEEKLRGLVEAVGGDPKTTTVDINPPSLNISVADKDGNKLFHVDFENGRARLYPTKDLSPKEASQIKDAASQAFGDSGKSADTQIRVFRKAEDMKKWESENAKKIQKWEDKYKFSTLLPPHQRPKKWERSIDARYASLLAFAESRNCGQDPDGKFSKGNTCASGIAADVAKGAASGAALGGVAAFGKTFLPQAAVSGAAAGAVAGAVKGVYDNKMRPTRVSARIKSLGLDDGGVAKIVTSLGGTPKSVATASGSSRLTVKVRDKDGKVTHVVDFTKKTVTIYPRSGKKELSDSDLKAIKKIAQDNSPKQTRFSVKTDSLSYAKRIARNGFEVAANKAGMLVATAIVSAAAPSVPDAVLGTADLIFDTHFTDSFYKSNKNAKR